MLDFSTGGISLAIQQITMITLVAVINFELYIGRKIIEDTLAVVGELFPIHIHPLYLNNITLLIM